MTEKERIKNLSNLDLCKCAEEWLEQLEYSNGVHWPLRTVAGETAAGDVFRELIERAKIRENRKIWE